MEVWTVEGKPPIVGTDGEVDLSNVRKLMEALEAAIPDAAAGIIIDMSGVTYVDSAGIQAVLFAYQRVRRTEGVLVLVLGNVDVRAIFALIHPELLPGFIVAESLEDARRALEAQAA